MTLHIVAAAIALAGCGDFVYGSPITAVHSRHVRYRLRGVAFDCNAESAARVADVPSAADAIARCEQDNELIAISASTLLASFAIGTEVVRANDDWKLGAAFGAVSLASAVAIAVFYDRANEALRDAVITYDQARGKVYPSDPAEATP